MTIKEKKEFLNSYKLINSEINRLLAECESYRELAKRISPTYSDAPKTLNNTSKLETAVEKIIELEHEMDKKVDQLQKKREEIEQAIQTVKNPTLEEVLKRKYINGQTWEQIAVDMNYSWRQTIRLHGKALEKMS